MTSDTNSPRKSLDELGLALPLTVWLVLVLTYLGAAVVLFFVPNTVAPFLRMASLAAVMFIIGIFCAFKPSLWLPRHDA